MPKQSYMISVNAEKLKEAILSRGHIADLETPLGVTKQAINGWLSKGRIPPRQLSKISKALKLDAPEINNITSIPKEKSFVLFRTNRNVAVSDEVKSEVLDVADDFFQLETLTEYKNSDAQIQLSYSDPVSMADAILKQVKLERSQLSLSSVLAALRNINIHVLFYDFGEKFVGSRAQAVCVRRGTKSAIFINSHEMIEDVLWRIFHELCHLFSGHTNVTKDDEEFCNKTATQVLTPDSFFKNNKTDLKSAFLRRIQLAPFMIEEIMSKYTASFEGVLLGLVNHKILEKNVENYLWKVCHNRKKNAVRVTNIICPNSLEDPVKFWSLALDDSNRNKFLQLQHFVRMGVILEKISSRRAAELLDTDEMTIQQLGRHWLAQYEKKNNL
jgi:Zn-dependent peptidase ImmA (M78 family)